MNLYLLADMMIKTIMNSLKLDKICLFGYGAVCDSFLKNTTLTNKIEGIFDNNPRKGGLIMYYRRSL